MLPVIILAGGLAKRMRPMTENIPKALLPVNGKPFIDLQLELLRKNGINRIVLCLGYLGEQIEKYINNADYEMDIAFSYDGASPLGTGGAVKKAAGITGKAFFVLYGDSYLEINYADVQQAWENYGKSALMTVYRNENRWDTSNVLFENNRIVRYNKTERTPAMQHIDYGLGVLQKDIFSGFSERFDLADVYASLAERGELSGYEAQSRFYEIGSLGGLKELEEHLKKGIDYNLATPSWHDSHLYTPAPRWRRRIIRKIVRKLDVKTCLEAGCAQPFLMLDLKTMGIKMTGCDISVPVIEDNAKTYPNMDFFVTDLCSNVEISEKYDLVTCSEVLEHLPDYQKAIQNICKLSNKYIIITVPSGKRYPIDEKVGHLCHYEPDMIVKPLEDNGFKTVRVTKTGFPFHSLYKRLINMGGGSVISEKYSSKRYGTFEKLVSSFVYFLFSFNVFPFGSQLIILAKKEEIDK